MEKGRQLAASSAAVPFALLGPTPEPPKQGDVPALPATCPFYTATLVAGLRGGDKSLR